MALYNLPDELLLDIARNLSLDRHSKLESLSSLSLVSKRLLPLAQEILYAHIALPVDASLQLLRTLLERPPLAEHVKHLNFAVVQRRVGRLYLSDYPNAHFDLVALRKLCLQKLVKMGYSDDHPWWNSVRNDVESSYGGLLLCVLPNLEIIHYTVREQHHGFEVSDPISAFFGTTSPDPAFLKVVATKLQELCTSDLVFLRSMAFQKLNVLRITSINVAMMLQLNGPKTFRGTAQLSELCVGISVAFIDRRYVYNRSTRFRDLIESLGCFMLSTLKITLEHEKVSVYRSSLPRRRPVLDAQIFIDEISVLAPTLKVLEIGFSRIEEPFEWTAIIMTCDHPVSSLAKFADMESLCIPQQFLFIVPEDDSEWSLAWPELPKKLRTLEIVCPDENIFIGLNYIVEEAGIRDNFQDLQKIVLQCRSGVGDEIYRFRWSNPTWLELLTHGITTHLRDLDAETVEVLPGVCENDTGDSDKSDYDEYESDEDMPDPESS